MARPLAASALGVFPTDTFARESVGESSPTVNVAVRRAQGAVMGAERGRGSFDMTYLAVQRLIDRVDLSHRAC